MSFTIWGLLAALPGLCIWAILLLLPRRHWSTRESLDADPAAPTANDLSRVTVLIPARNEADVIEKTLQGLTSQGPGLKVLVIDDLSTDQTGAIALTAKIAGLEVVRGDSLPDGWSGKLWALEQGRKRITSEMVLLLDADIHLLPGTIQALVHKLERDRLDLVSLMAHLHMQGLWEKLLVPAFVFFFKLLYPFRLSNSPAHGVAAAAGGCLLIKKSLLDDIGAFGSLRNALIDDCALAHQAKKAGGKTWIGLTHSAISLRPYRNLQDIWDMVARSAYTQLRYSFVLLLICTALMAIMFLFPLTAVLSLEPPGLVAMFLMYLCYLPTLRYYGIQPLWGWLLPVAGILYLCMAWTSAWRHAYRRGAVWKGRSYSMTAGKNCNFR